MDDDDENVESRGLIPRYEERPESLENTCLADFACWYTANKAVSFQSRKATNTSGDGYLKENSPSVTSESQNDDDNDEAEEEEHIDRGEEKNDLNQEYRKRTVPRIAHMLVW